MKTNRAWYFIPLLIFVHFAGVSQQTSYYTNIQHDIDIAKELFAHEKYISTFREFQKIQQQVDIQSELYSEAEYYKSVSSLKAGYTAGSKMLTTFTKEHPDSPYINGAMYYLGGDQFDKKQYALAIKTFSEVKREGLTEDEKVKIAYQNGYANLMSENLDIASKEFYSIKDANNLFSVPATYYWAHIMYLREKYPEALEGFRKLSDNPAYSKVIPMYISHIYYKQENYNEVVNYAASVIRDVEEEQKPELSRLIGDSYFHLGDYDQAIPWMEAYFNVTKLTTREENYVLGYSYHHTGAFEKAIPPLESASKGKDAMAQNAYFHLADCYIKTGDKEKAKMAYDAASKLDFDKKIEEEALFNYAKLTYELSFSPFNETIKAFDSYIEKYPNSENNAEAYKILSDVYMVTKNYKDALASIEKIKTKTPAILKAYQRVAFYRGLEFFNNLDYKQAITYFDLSLENGTYDRAIQSQAIFWKAESHYRTADYNNAVNNFTKFLATTGAQSVPEYKQAEYNLGYAYLKLNDYESAANHFKKYLSINNNSETEKHADALNRIGDYYFVSTDYPRALQYYQESYMNKRYEPDYALYQIAFCKGLQQEQQGKIENLSQLLASFPESAFQDDALFELGRAYERLSNNQKSTEQYNKIIQNHKQSIFYRKALLQLGLINFNNGDYNSALAQYKEVAEKFSETPEAQAALLGIKNCYVELNNVDGYVAYSKQTGTVANITVSEQDSMSFMAAERQYMAEDKGAQAQLEKYLQQFPNGSFVINSRFYLAELFYKDGKFMEANKHYTFVADQPDNIFTEQALSRAAELTYNGGDYLKTLELCNRLESMASSKWNILRANTGQMRCNLKLTNYEKAISSARKVKKSDTANEAFIREANYTEGKANYMLNRPDIALETLKLVATDVSYEFGAEAKYLIAEIYFKQKNVQKTEDEIMDFIDKNTPYQYWLGKSFILLSDVYINKNDEFQAKHTLKSLVENYNNETDGIIEEATKKLMAIENQEKTDQQKAIDNSYQIKIKEQ